MAHKLVEQIAPAMQRTSGYLRIERTTLRRGDNTQMAQISFVDDINAQPSKSAAAKTEKAASTAKPATKVAKKPAAKPKATAKKGDK